MTTDLDTIALLRDSAQRYAADHYGFLQRHAVLAAGFSPEAWRDYAGLGWLALRLPEEAGGLDADASAIGAIMEIVGARLLMEPILASAVLATGLVVRQASAEQKAALLPQLADGSLKFAFADEDETPCVWRDGRLSGQLSGAKLGVLHGDLADRLIVTAHDPAGEAVLCLVDPTSPGVERRAYRLVDGRGAAIVRFDGAPAEPLGQPGATAAESIAEARDEAAVALCAEACGVIDCLVATTNDYLKVRRQFGKPIGSNQALQHRMVELYLLQQEAGALTRAAQQAMHFPAQERARIVSGARAYVASAARHVANEAVQMHGGVGVTEELDVSHYFRRAMVIGGLFGNRDAHFQRFVEAELAA